MEDIVSVETEESVKEDFIAKDADEINQPAPSLSYGFKTYYRLLRKNFSAYLRNHIKKQCYDILYITDGNFSKEYILNLQKRYPDKIMTVLVPHFGTLSRLDKFVANIDYFAQNKPQSAKLYKYHTDSDNIHIYGIYSKNFSDLENPLDLYKLPNLVHYSACARKAAKKLKPDIIHAENIPFCLGLEFCRNKCKSAKIIQTLHNIEIYEDIEPFWAAINLLDKNGMTKLCRDGIIKKNIAALFGIKNVNGFSKFRECLNYLYQNFERYRKTYQKDEDTNENILIDRLNKRVLYLFGSAFYNGIFNPIYFSAKEADVRAVNSGSKNVPDWFADFFGSHRLRKGKCHKSNQKIAHPFDINNYRFYREYNKQYLIKEFAEKQINSKFVDLNLFGNNEVKIYGYLDAFYKGNLIFADFSNIKDNDIKIITNAVLKCFEFKKNIQVIFNMPADCDNSYLKSFIDFMEQQPSLNGKWLFIEGKINLPQFVASSDIILLPTSNVIGIEDILFTALQYGCIPVTSDNGICGDVVVDIFDDIVSGFGFKNYSKEDAENRDGFANTLLKAVNFFVQNFTSWNILIQNALNYDSSWNNELLEEYNKLYDRVLGI